MFQGTSGIKSEEYVKAAGPNAEGTLAFLEGAPPDQLPGGAAFLAAYDRAGFTDPPEAYGPFAYVAGMLVTMAVERVGPDRVKVAGYLKHRIKDVPSIIGPVTFDDHGQNILATVTPRGGMYRRSVTMTTCSSSWTSNRTANGHTTASRWFRSTNGRIDRSYAGNATRWSPPAAASAAASWYAPTTARLLPCPDKNDGA